MHAGVFAGLLFGGSFVAGLLGALTGLGGGVVLIPLLVIGFHVDMRYAIGASLVSVIATSSGAAAAYVREGYSNVRIGMFLEVATTIGAVFGAFLAAYVGTRWLAIVFGLVLIYSAWLSRSHAMHADHGPAQSPYSDKLRLSGSYPDGEGGQCEYKVDRITWGWGMMFGAGTLSGLLGIGSGAVKVLAMDKIMRIPFKVSTTTSNFMIGVTAAASAGIYLARGYVVPGLAFPVMLGVLAGSLLGARVLVKAQVGALRTIFGFVILGLGIEMIVSGWMGKAVMSDAIRRSGEAVQNGESPRQNNGFNDERLELIMGRILQTGVLIASSVVLVGGMMYLIANWSATPRYRTFRPDHKLSLLHAGSLITGIAHGQADAILQLGILLLIATPIARVVCAVVGFSVEKDRLYAGVSTVVLAVLIWGMLRGG